MARNRYTPDEFDRLPEGSPRGVHRRVPRPWFRFATFCAVVFGSVGLAWGAAHLVLIADDVSWLNWIRAPFDDDPAPIVTPMPSDTPSLSPSPSPSPSPTYDLVLGANVVVFNDSAPSGVAGEVQGYIVEQSDFSNVTSTNWPGASPPANAVRFRTEEYGDSARFLADLLGIATATIGPTEGADIAIVLVEDVTLGPEPTPSISP
ncbi:MAG: LytR C-terminal domain-containing protein [Demequinaceae bacterium]|nr:LytR C-terminal domain-containing protein [Demequinaceae bacterium]